MNKGNKIYLPTLSTTFYFNAYNELEALDFAKKCIGNNVSFDFMNEVEFYITTVDEQDFLFKQSILGTEIINEKNSL